MANEFKPRKGLLLEDNIKILFGDAGAEGEIYSDGSTLIIEDPATSSAIIVATVLSMRPGGTEVCQFNTNGLETADANIFIYREDANDPLLKFEDGDGGGGGVIGYDSTDGSFHITYGTSTISSTTIGRMIIRSDGDIEFRVGASQVADLTDDTNLAVGIGANYDSLTTNTTILGQGAGAACAAADNTFIGYSAGAASAAGDTGNTFIGSNAGLANTVAYNTAVGFGALAGAGASENIGIGHSAGAATNAGGYSVFIGGEAGSDGLSISTGVFIGYRAGQYLSGSSNTVVGHYCARSHAVTKGTGIQNVFVGKNCALEMTTAADNSCLGFQAGTDLTEGAQNVCIGSSAGLNISTGDDNVAIGYQALDAATSSNGNVAIGTNALGLYLGDTNIAIGYDAAASCVAINCIAIGYGAMQNSTSMDQSVVIGSGACGLGVCTGGENVVIGDSAALDLTSATDLVVIGRLCAANLTTTTASENTFIGSYCANTLIDYGKGNTCIGFESFYTAEGVFSTGQCDYNTAVGWKSLRALTQGYQNTAIGYNAGVAITTGDLNICIGAQAGDLITTANSSIAIGTGSLGVVNSKTGASNIAIGTNALGDVTNGTHNIAMGYQTSVNTTTADYSISIGYQAMGLGINTANNNTAIGYQALYNMAGGYSNIMIGPSTGLSLSTSTCYQNIGLGDNSCGGGATSGAISTRYNIAIGQQALQAIKGTASACDGNIGIGYRAGYAITAGGLYNVAIGYVAGNAVTTGDYNVSIGYGSDCAATGNYGLALGYSAVATASGQIMLGSINHTSIYCHAMNQATVGGTSQTLLVDTGTGEVGYTSSSIRYKENVVSLVTEKSSKIFNLRPVSFNWKATGVADMGLIAEEVAEVMPEIATYIPERKIDPEGSTTMIPISVNYMGLIVPLLAEVQKLRAAVTALEEAKE